MRKLSFTPGRGLPFLVILAVLCLALPATGPVTKMTGIPACAFSRADDLNGTITPISHIHEKFETFNGTARTVEGVVVAVNGELNSTSYFITSGTTGLEVVHSIVGLKVGDLVRLNGTITKYKYMHKMDPVAQYWVRAGSAPYPLHIYNSSLLTNTTQGVLSKINGFLYDIDGHRAQILSAGRLFSVNTTRFDLSLYDKSAVSLTGIVTQQDSMPRIHPRAHADLVNGTHPYNTISIDGTLTDFSAAENILDDPDDDSTSSGNDIYNISATWDATDLYISAEYYLSTSSDSFIVYLDTARASGLNNLSTLDTWPRNIALPSGFTADVMIARTADNPAAHIQVRKISNTGVTTNVTLTATLADNGATVPGKLGFEVDLPWSLLFGGGPSWIPDRRYIGIVAAVTGGDGSYASDYAPGLKYESDYHKSPGYSEVCPDLYNNTTPDDFGDVSLPGLTNVVPLSLIDTDVGTVTVTLTFNEDMWTSVNPFITLTGLTSSYTFYAPFWVDDRHFTMKMDLVDDDEESTGTFHISGARDDMNNLMAPNDTHTMDVDTLAPTVSSASVDTPEIYTGDLTQKVFVDYSETMDTSVKPNVTIDGIKTNKTDTSSGMWTNSTHYEVTLALDDDDEEDSTISVKISQAKDLLGNVQPMYTLPNPFTVDTLEPTVANLAADTPVVYDGDLTQGITLTFSENMNTTVKPTITINNIFNPKSDSSSGTWTDQTHYTVTLTLDDDGQEDSSLDVQVENALDLAGNQMADHFEYDPFIIDTKNPSVQSLDLSRTFVTDAGLSLQATVRFSEDMDGAKKPWVSVSGIKSPLNQSSSGTWLNASTFVVDLTVKDDNEAADAVVRIGGAFDPAGNPMTPYENTGALAVDTKNPSVADLDLDSLVISDYDLDLKVTIRFIKAMNTSVKPTVQVKNIATPITDSTGGSWLNDTAYRITLVFSDDDEEPAGVQLSVTGAKDAAGNTMPAFTLTDPFVLDTRNPKVSIAVSNNKLIRSHDGSQLVVTLTFTETMNTSFDPVIDFDPDLVGPSVLTLSSGTWSQLDTVFTAVYDIVAYDEEGYDVDIIVSEAYDLARNPVDPVPQVMPQFDADMILPSLTDQSDDIGTTGDAFLFKAQADDTSGITKVSVKWAHGKLGGNLSLTKLSGTTWQGTVVLDQSMGDLTYTMYATDGSGNVRSSLDWYISVIDNDLPVITDKTKGPGTTGDELLFSLGVTDNIGIKTARVRYWFGSAVSEAVNETMEGSGGDWSLGVKLPLKSLDPVRYVFYVQDQGNAINQTPAKTIQVVDNDPPVPRADDISIYTVVGDSVVLNGSLSYDNIGIVYYSWSYVHQGVNVTLEEMTTTVVFLEAGDYDVEFLVRDAAGLEGIQNIYVGVEPVEDDDVDDDIDDDDEADTDGDGLPDAWENETWGDLSQGAEGDPDGDGFTNLEEYDSGTDPTDKDSHPFVADDDDDDDSGGGLGAGATVLIILLIIVVIILAAGGVYFYMKKQKEKQEEEEEKAKGDDKKKGHRGKGKKRDKDEDEDGDEHPLEHELDFDEKSYDEAFPDEEE